MRKIYVVNLSSTTTEDDLRGLFEGYGRVGSVKIIIDTDTGAPKGFGFVEMDDGVEDAIEGLNQSEFQGRMLIVKEERSHQSHGDKFHRN